MAHFYETFARFVNGTLKRVLGMKNIIEPDFLAGTPIKPTSYFHDNYPVSPEMISDDLDFHEIVLLIPKAKPTEKKLYLVKTFSIEIWICALIFVVFASGAVSICRVTAKNPATFWRTFGHIFRSSLGQPIPYSKSSKVISTLYIISIIFGFILTVWFSTILGSFLTTTLFDKQARSVKDLRMLNIKIRAVTINGGSAFDYENVEVIRDLIVDRGEQKEDAILVPTHKWYYVVAPLESKLNRDQQYVQSDFILERSFFQVQHVFDSIYKERINRFIGLVKDCGLYRHWCEQAAWEYLVSKVNPHYPRVEENYIQVLQLEFFIYPLLIWLTGIMFSCISFLFEMAIFFFK